MSMSTLSSINNEMELENANKRLAELIDAPKGSREKEEFQTLLDLVIEYENYHHPIEGPYAVGMIEYRLEKANLTKSDLIPLIGSKSIVEEVLERKRPLTIPMVRALNKHLGIDLESLVSDEEIDENEGVDSSKFPIAAMKKLGWLPRSEKSDEDLLISFIEQTGGLVQIPRSYSIKNFDARRNALTDIYALQAWCQKVVGEALTKYPSRRFEKNTINQEFIQSIASLSRLDNGPQQAIHCLSKAGIALVYVEQLPDMYVDCAIVKATDGSPVIGITLRNDNLDSFWFSILHSVAHIWKHFSEVHYFFVDDFDIKECHCNVDWSVENEADQIALRALNEIEEWSKITLGSKDYSRIAAETVKLPSSSISLKVGNNDPSLQPKMSELKTKPLREYFL